MLLAVALLASTWAPARLAAQADDVLIFAAASMQTALDELTPAAERATATHVRISYAATSTLARQIESGAPADLFISADLDWMDYVDARHLVRHDTRIDLLGNTLVLVAPAKEPVILAIARGFPLAATLGSGRLAVADPDAVPAGKYAKAALTALGVWDSVASKLAPAENVRSALLLVSRGEVPLGIVYRTDAAADPGVMVVDTFPADSHPAIVYPAALTPRASAGAARVLAFLRSEAAGAVFTRQGFSLAPK
jgi:molybdate transport system substrate-binding protein